MNTPNNKRRQNTILKIHTAFLTLLQNRELNDITVTDICSLAEINRTTFYANYKDIAALVDAEMNLLEQESIQFFRDGVAGNKFEEAYLQFFTHIKENQQRYGVYFKRGLSGRFLIPDTMIQIADTYHQDTFGKYHLEYSRWGLNAVIRMWLKTGCKESPEEMVSIIRSEYNNAK